MDASRLTRPTEQPDTTNRFAVAAGTSGHVQILGLYVLSQRMVAGGLTENEALNLAAWLVAVASTGNPAKFVRLYEAVCET